MFLKCRGKGWGMGGPDRSHVHRSLHLCFQSALKHSPQLPQSLPYLTATEIQGGSNEYVLLSAVGAIINRPLLVPPNNDRRQHSSFNYLWGVSMYGDPRREAGYFRCLPPVCNLRAFSLIPLFYIFSFVLLPSPVALSVLSFSAFGPFS